MNARLLAITPPTGEIGGAALDVWLDAGVRPGEVHVLLRTPGQGPSETLARAHRLMRRCEADGHPVWLSVDAGGPAPDPRWRLEGLVVRGDAGPDKLSRMRVSYPDLRIARSAHVAAAVAGELAFSSFAPVFTPRTTQAGRTKTAVGLDALRSFCARVPEPVFALGGVTPDRAQECLAAGAWGLATIRGFFGPPRTLVHDVSALLEHARFADGLPTDP